MQILTPALAFVLEPLNKYLNYQSHMTSVVDVGRRRHVVEDLRAGALQSFETAVQRALPRKTCLAAMAYLAKVAMQSPPGSNAQFTAVNLFHEISKLGLGGDTGEMAIAHAIQGTIIDYIHSFEMRVDWVDKQTRVPGLRDWVTEKLQRSVEPLLRGIRTSRSLQFTTSEIRSWEHHAINSLGRARLAHLLTYVQLYPQSMGVILDLKEYLALPDAKQHLAQIFMKQMEDRIDHAGVTTAELLKIYLAVIRVFKALDNRCVLLEKVAQPLREYLRARPDTVKVIAASFLAELDESDELRISGLAEVDDCCVEISREVVRNEDSAAQSTSSLDWNDMTWLPDPIDAGPDYKNTKSNDVISYLLTLFDKDTFINEVQNILGERLLRSEDEGLKNENRLVDMLKSRLGTDKLQSAEVMVRDMSDSARIMKLVRSAKSKIPLAADVYDAIPESGISFGALAARMQIQVPSNPDLKACFIAVIKEAAIAGSNGNGNMLFRNPAFRRKPATEHRDGNFEAKILSSFFWPELRDDDFKIPEPIRAAQEDYEMRFKQIKHLRRLRWLSALGRATVELELEDRTVKVEAVKTWVAAVIYAFEEESPTRKSVSELEEQLNMDELLVRNAVSFWVGQQVLHEVETDVYEVMETLPKEGDEVQQPLKPVVQMEQTVSALKTQNAVLKDNKAMYEMFIVGMLTNGGAMDPARVAMMLKMVVPGGFNFGEDEVLWLLQGMETEGRVEKRGDTWVIKK